MVVQDFEAPKLQEWIVSHVSNYAEVDPDILGEYVIALLQHDEPIDHLKSMCLTDLRDFLHSNTEAFVDELFRIYVDKSYLNDPKPEPEQTQVFPGLNSLNSSNDNNNSEQPQQNNDQNSFQKHFNNNNQFDNNDNNNGNPNNFSFKNQGHNNNNNNFRGGRYNNRGGRFQRFNNNNGGFNNNNNNWGNNQAALAAAAAVLAANGNNGNIDPSVIQQMAATMGFQFNNNNNNKNFQNGFNGGNFNNNNNGFNPNFNKHNNNHNGNNNLKSNRNVLMEIATTQPDEEFVKRKLVIEKLPADKFNEEDLKNYFSQFGEITNLSLDHVNHLAELEYATHHEALAAWSSPAAIFDNRFVKVYWRKTDENDASENKDKIDVEAVKKVQAEKQKAFEEKMAKKKANQEKLLEINRQKQKLLQLQKEQQEKLLQLAEKAGNSDEITSKKGTTAALQAQLDALKREAEQLGIPSSGAPAYNPYHGRGGFRGRGRAHHYSPYARPIRGGFSSSATSRYNLDLRPRTIEVKPVPADKEEAFRGYLLSMGEYEDLSRTDENTIQVTFKDRRTAETFYYSSKSISDVGEIEKAWKNTPTKPTTETKPPTTTSAPLDWSQSNATTTTTPTTTSSNQTISSNVPGIADSVMDMS